MPELPRARISLNTQEIALLRPGLDLIVKGLAGAREGCFTHSNPFAFKGQNPEAPMEYSATLDSLICELRRNLCFSGRRKFRCDPIECSALQFALRQAKKHAQVDRPDAEDLIDKFERYRKRAKRRALAAGLINDYKAGQEEWTRFRRWMKSRILHFKGMQLPSRPRSLVRMRFEGVSALAASIVVPEYAKKEPEKLKHVLRLFIDELRRGRHPVTIRSVLDRTPEAIQVFTDFLSRRLTDDALQYHAKSLASQLSERGERIQRVLQLDFSG